MNLPSFIESYCIEGNGLTVRNPATGRAVATVRDHDASDARAMIAAAAAAWPDWRVRVAKNRAALLMAWRQRILDHRAELAALVTAESGKPLAEAAGEIDYGVAFLQWFAEEAKRVYGDITPTHAPDRRVLSFKQPIGVSAAITPWNFPVAMITRKAAPALAAGCPMIVKPAEATPLSALALEALAHEAGIPRDVFRVIATTRPAEIGAEFCGNPTVRKLSFTGSTAVGKLLMRDCAATVKKVSMELGGNAPFIVFDDADLDAAIEGAVASKYRNAGQTCICANRFLVADKVHDSFVEKLARRASALRVGNGAEPGVQVGPLINGKAVEKVEALVRDALEAGARAHGGGARLKQPALNSPRDGGGRGANLKPKVALETFESKASLRVQCDPQFNPRHESHLTHDALAGDGHFFAPTVLSGVTPDMAIANQEIFGPVAPVIRFHTEDEAIRIANDTPYGLAAYFYARDIGRIWRVMEALEYGMVGVNEGMISVETAPFGGVKESGVGREGSRHGLDEYLELKYCLLGGLNHV